MSCEWKELEHNTWVYYNQENGQIKGKITTTFRKDTYMALVNGVFLGEYVSLEYAKSAVENPPIQNKTPNQHYQEVRP